MATTRVPTWPAGVFYEANWLTGPLQATPPPLWTDVTNRFIGAWGTTHGADFELNRNQAGELHPIVDNRDGALDPTNALGPYAGVAPYKGLRIRKLFGPNELTADQATAGELTGFLGTVPTRLNVVSDATAGNFSIVTSGSAFQGTQVYQAALASGATVGASPLRVVSQPCVPGRVYSFQAQCRIPSGNSVSTQAQILWFNQSGTQIGSVTGTAQTLTSGSTTWVQLAASGTAPSGAFSAALRVQIAAGTLSATTTWQVDGLQWENSGIPTTWQQPGTLGANLLPRVIATGSMSMDPVRDAVSNWWYSTGAGTLAQANYLATAAPPGQTSALAWTTPSGTTSSNAVLYAGVAPAAAPTGPVQDCVQVTAAQQYTASVYLSRTSSADTTVAVTLSVQWYNSAGTALTPSAGTAATVAVGSWVRATVTGTAPAGAVWGRISAAITTPATTTASNTIYATAWQFEQAGSASTWVDPGPTFFGFWGFWEQFPQTWRLSGTWGELDAVGVDALAGLAQFTVIAPFIHEVNALNPSFFYPLNDPQGSSQVADVSGKRIPAPIENSPFGVGSLTLGNAVTSATGNAFLGTPGPVATFANSPANTPQQPQTYVSIYKTTAMPGPPTSGAWTRSIAFRSPTVPASGTFPTLWNANTPSYGTDLSLFQIYIDPTTGLLVVQLSGAAGTGPVVTSAASVCDGNWHLVALAYTPGGYVDVYLDGSRIYHDNNSGSGYATPTNIVTDVLGCSITPGASDYSLGFVGDAAHATQFPFAMTQTQATNLYNSWRNASSGESTGARFQRLLNWFGYTGPTAIDSGSTKTMGPANDLNGGTALDGAYAIATTETGDAYATNGAVLTFKARSALYNSQPLFVFGENQANGEWPYEDVQLPVDPLHTFNVVSVTQWSAATGTFVNGYAVTGQVATAQDTASQQANFPRTAPAVTVNSTSFAEVQAAAQYLLQRYKVNRMRCKGLSLHVAAIPGLWRVAAQLDKGVRIRVMRRPPWRSSLNPIQFDGFITKTAWAVDPKTMDAYLTVEAAPADLNTYWTLAALHTTLHAQAASGQNQATINALADSQYNALSSSLPQGYQLVFDPGTAIQETMTLSPTGIPATTAGYFTATLTFTSNFQFTHQPNAVVCEPLPQGYTDPTTWDANSVSGAASTTLNSGANSGTNQITVKALPDGATNAVGSDWNTGDLLWIGVGTPNFEGYNLLTPNLATAGEGALPLAAGATGFALGMGSDLGSPTVTASGSAFQGANVWQVSVAGGASTPSGLIYLLKIPYAAGQGNTVSAYVRSATSGANPQVYLYLKYLDANGNSLGQTNSATSTLTGSPTASWTRLVASATPPAGAVWAQAGLVLTSAPAGAWAFQADALQAEANAAASAFQVCPQVLSVATTVPGYSTCVITLNTNLANSHSQGETVCDPLPPGVTSPGAVAATARVAY